MSPAYVDTGVLLKLYVPEPESPGAIALVRGYRPPLPFTSLHRAEMGNALALKVFRKEATFAAVAAALGALDEDIGNGLWIAPEGAFEDACRIAAQLSTAHSTRLGTRTLDVLHVALALGCKARDFVTRDERQAALADAVGLRVVRLPSRP